MISQKLLLILFAELIYSLEIDFNLDKSVIVGEKHYGEMVKKIDSYGDCWKKTMLDLHVGCKHLTEDVQSRLALSFANCFLSHAGSEPCRCADDVPIASCLGNSSERMFSTYREFFTHTQSICHYLQHREWQEQAAETVLVLTKNSQAVSKKLDESFKSQTKILHLQEAAMSEQKRLISNGRILNAELLQSRNTARDMYNEFKTTTHEQKFLLFQLFDKIKDLQNFVLGELTGVYTVTYYIVAVSFVYMMTSVPRTAGARFWLMLLISSNIAIERVLSSYCLQDGDPFDANGLLYFRIWLCRKIVCFIAFVILMATYYFYRDYNKINNQLLQEIQHQNKELQNFIKGLSCYENILKLSSPVNALTHAVVSLQSFEQAEKVTVTDVPRNESQAGISSRIIQQDIQNKENNPVTSTYQQHMTISTADLTVNLKNTQNRRILKKTLASPNSPMSFDRETSLSELQSPPFTKYNLRRSSRLNSPQLNVQ